jgi:hypothetical protein
MSEFKGKAGTIYVNASRDGNNERVNGDFEVWFEDFCILGQGKSEIEALDDAWRHTGDIMALIADARIQMTSTENAANALAAEMES